MGSSALKVQRVAVRSSRRVAVDGPRIDLRAKLARAESGAVAVCSCGRSFTADAWAGLRLNGSQRVEGDDGRPTEVLELRTCACGSTLSKPWVSA